MFHLKEILSYFCTQVEVKENMVQILRKQGWVLNPNDKIVNAILKRVELNEGECPCMNNSSDKHCPCTDYRENDQCHCGLYLKVNTGAHSVEV